MRTKSVVPRLRAKKRLFKRVKGFVGGRRRLLRTAKETIIRAGVYARRDRRRKKRDFRRLWIIRLNAAARERGLRYSQFIVYLAPLRSSHLIIYLAPLRSSHLIVYLASLLAEFP